MSTKVTHPQERSKIDKFIATLKQLSLYHWIAAILAMYGLLSILGSYNPWLAANLPGWLIGKGVGPLIVAIAVAFYAYAEVNTPDDDPPVRQSEFIAEVSQLSSKIEDKQRTIDDLKRKIDKTRGELRNTPTKLPDRDLFVTTPPLNGDDVYLLQSKLIKLGYPGRPPTFPHLWPLIFPPPLMSLSRDEEEKRSVHSSVYPSSRAKI
ncbi:MAG: hypothetical protein ISS62_10325 [Desulfobacteraceae bacterium]|nr:hypothetical protein [Desulfobacteraceae bacterium]